MNASLRRLGVILALLGTVALPARADNAIVVGVNHYRNLPDEAQLRGPDNDAEAVKQRLSSLGFAVTLLTDEHATRQGILDAFGALKEKTKPSERFVFYFAGHGSTDKAGNGVIVPSDAQFDDEASLISRDDLYEAVRAVPAAARTVILDSCFSGAMPRAFSQAKSLHPRMASRFYPLFRSGAKDLVVVPVNTRSQPMVAGDNVCYFVACDPHQRACEYEIGGKQRGLFSYYLTKRLTSLQELWEPVQTDVTQNVMTDSQGEETPMLTTVYSRRPVLGSGGAPSSPVAAGKHSIWDQFNDTQDDPNRLQFAMRPDRTTVKIGEKFDFAATPARDGYLVVMELDTDGNVSLLYPQSRSASDAQVTAGVLVRIPQDAANAYTVNKEGMENVRAVLFRRQEDAQDLLSAFPEGLTVGMSGRSARAIPVLFANAFSTGSLSFEVSGEIP